MCAHLVVLESKHDALVLAGGGGRLSEDITAKTPDIPITNPASQKLRSRDEIFRD